MRIERAELELSYADKYDKVIINDQLEVAQQEMVSTVKDFINGSEGEESLPASASQED